MEYTDLVSTYSQLVADAVTKIDDGKPRLNVRCTYEKFQKIWVQNSVYSPLMWAGKPVLVVNHDYTPKRNASVYLVVGLTGDVEGKVRRFQTQYLTSVEENIDAEPVLNPGLRNLLMAAYTKIGFSERAAKIRTFNDLHHGHWGEDRLKDLTVPTTLGAARVKATGAGYNLIKFTLMFPGKFFTDIVLIREPSLDLTNYTYALTVGSAGINDKPVDECRPRVENWLRDYVFNNLKVSSVKMPAGYVSVKFLVDHKFELTSGFRNPIPHNINEPDSAEHYIKSLLIAELKAKNPEYSFERLNEDADKTVIVGLPLSLTEDGGVRVSDLLAVKTDYGMGIAKIFPHWPVKVTLAR